MGLIYGRDVKSGSFGVLKIDDSLFRGVSSTWKTQLIRLAAMDDCTESVSAGL